MSTSTDDLYTKVVVRRTSTGITPFAWEVQRETSVILVSPDRFRTMEAAYSAGQAKLGEFLSSRPVKQKKVRTRRVSLRKLLENDDGEADDANEFDLDVHSNVSQAPA